MDEVISFGKEHRDELIIVGLSTALFQLISYLKTKKREPQNKLSTKLISMRVKKFDQIQQHYKPMIPQQTLNSENCLVDEVKYLFGRTSKIYYVHHLIDELDLKKIPAIKSPLLIENGRGFLSDKQFVYKGSYVLSKNIYASTQELQQPIQWLLAGPRKFLYFQPKQVKAAIVTCGGLCPGLNVVIRQIFINLNVHYGCPEVWGINFGYGGIYSGDWRRLDLNQIKNLQLEGGTTLGSSRGGFSADQIIKALVAKNINQLYVIGGDGTHRGIHVLHEELRQRKLQISVIGVPKTIDNDIPIIDKSFGFQTSVSESIRSIRSAYVESKGVPYGIGLVRLMGRDAGFIAMEATNASRDVNVCLIPEATFNIYGKHGVLEYIYKQLLIEKHLVIVVAEGAGNGVLDLKDLKEEVKVDESGNPKLSDIGGFLKKQIVEYCKEKGLKATLKYIDPTYMIRTVSANAHDIRMCSELAAGAVHGAMAGFTGFTVGHVNNRSAMIPVQALENKKNRVDLASRPWQRVLAGTGQPEFKQQEPMMQKK